MSLDPLMLARLQFAVTIMFHYLFPTLTIGLGMLLVVMEGLFLKTRNPIYEAMTKFWVKIFALNFSLGVATGIVMEFQFGTNWAGYSRFVGDVFGAALAAEGVFAFFLESGFLAILLFGWDKVSPRMHFFSTVMVALGSIFSAFWITLANSWQQIPTAYHIVGHGALHRAEISDFWALLANPSAIERFFHSVLGGGITGAFFVMSVSAFYILKGRHLVFARKSFLIALISSCLMLPLQAAVGSRQGELVAEYQPAKLAAMEALFETTRGAPEYIFGIPDPETSTVKFGIPIPGLLSFLAKHDFNAELRGYNTFPADERPPVLIPFFAFHGMVGLGFYMLGLVYLALFLWWRKGLFENRWMMRVFVVSVLAPYAANELGWAAAEVGRQPWIVYGLLRTSEGLSKAVFAEDVLLSLILFVGVYALLFLVFIYSLDRKIKHGPEEPPEMPTKEVHPVEDWLTVSGHRVDPGGLKMEDL